MNVAQQEIKIRNYYLDDAPNKVLGVIEFELGDLGIVLHAKAIRSDKGAFFVTPTSHKLNGAWINDWHLDDEDLTKVMCQRIRGALQTFLESQAEEDLQSDDVPF